MASYLTDLLFIMAVSWLKLVNDQLINKPANNNENSD